MTCLLLKQLQEVCPRTSGFKALVFPKAALPVAKVLAWVPVAVAVAVAVLAPMMEAPVMEAPMAEAPMAEAPMAEAPMAEALVAEALVAEGVRVVAAVPAAAAAPVDPAAFAVPAGLRNTYFKFRAIGKTLVLAIEARASFQGVVSLIV